MIQIVTTTWIDFHWSLGNQIEISSHHHCTTSWVVDNINTLILCMLEILWIIARNNSISRVLIIFNLLSFIIYNDFSFRSCESQLLIHLELILILGNRFILNFFSIFLRTLNQNNLIIYQLNLILQFLNFLSVCFNSENSD